MPDIETPELFLRSMAFVCHRHGWSRPHLYNLIRTGKVRAFKQGYKVSVDVNSADAFATAVPLVLREPKPKSFPPPPKPKRRARSLTPTRRKRSAEERRAGA